MKKDFQKDIQQTLKEIDELKKEQQKLIETLAIQQESLKNVTDLSLNSASLINAIDNPNQEMQTSSLLTLSKLSNSKFLNNDTLIESSFALTAGKYLNQIMTLIVDSTLRSEHPPNLLSFIKLENRLSAIFSFGENKGIIPKTDSPKGWKGQVLRHEPLYRNIASLSQEE